MSVPILWGNWYDPSVPRSFYAPGLSPGLSPRRLILHGFKFNETTKKPEATLATECDFCRLRCACPDCEKKRLATISASSTAGPVLTWSRTVGASTLTYTLSGLNGFNGTQMFNLISWNEGQCCLVENYQSPPVPMTLTIRTSNPVRPDIPRVQTWQFGLGWEVRSDPIPSSPFPPSTRIVFGSNQLVELTGFGFDVGSTFFLLRIADVIYTGSQFSAPVAAGSIRHSTNFRCGYTGAPLLYAGGGVIGDFLSPGEAQELYYILMAILTPDGPSLLTAFNAPHHPLSLSASWSG